jgi:hypothetical protein
VREFNDDHGNSWTATVSVRKGLDYKGRYSLVFHPTGEPEPLLNLADVRWNSEKTALRTVETMSEVELRRRLRWAVDRSKSRPSSGPRRSHSPGAPVS